jgi:hypothetical protein
LKVEVVGRRAGISEPEVSPRTILLDLRRN